MSLLSKQALAGQQVVARNGQASTRLGVRVVRRFKKDDNERVRELASLPEQPITTRHPPPPADLADILPNPGEL